MATVAQLRWKRAKRIVSRVAFYGLLLVIAVYTIFPFYWAIVSSLKSGSDLFEVEYWISQPHWDNYVAVFREQPFGRNILNSLFVSVSTVTLSLALALAAAYAIGRVQFRGRMLLMFVILGVSMFPQIAVLSGMFELINSHVFSFFSGGRQQQATRGATGAELMAAQQEFVKLTARSRRFRLTPPSPCLFPPRYFRDAFPPRKTNLGLPLFAVRRGGLGD